MTRSAWFRPLFLVGHSFGARAAVHLMVREVGQLIELDEAI